MIMRIVSGFGFAGIGVFMRDLVLLVHPLNTDEIKLDKIGSIVNTNYVI